MGRRTSKEIADDIREQQSQLAHVSGFGAAGVDPAYVPDRESFDSYIHQQIWDLVHEKLDPGAMGQIASEWSYRADKLHELFDTFSREVKSEFASWSGAFASTAQQSTATFVSAGAEQHDTARTVQRLIALNSSAAQTVKSAIPPPPPPYQEDPDPVKEAADGAARRTAHNVAAAEAQASAQDTMNFVYNPTMPASGDSVPRFVPLPPGPAPGAPSPGDVNQQPSVSTGGDSPSEPTNNSKNGETGDGNGETGDGKPAEQPPGENPQPNNPTTPAQTTTSSLNDPAATNTPKPSSTSNTPTVPAGVNPVDKTQASPSATVPSVPGSPGSRVPGTPRVTSGTPGSPGNRPGGPGISIPGQPQPPAGTNPAGPAGVRSTTGSSTAPMSGMPGASRGQGSDSDRSKGSPDYLRRTHEELVQVDPTMPAVIGWDATDDEPPPSGKSDNRTRGDG
ncbi:hypothetical protein [Nocardia sp. NPDC050175]|uniref:hypothetical protein n=1 Tax=Nocardia sp. NPDC050175 TaxID=3364317 RepID=UPI0037AD2682